MPGCRRGPLAMVLAATLACAVVSGSMESAPVWENAHPTTRGSMGGTGFPGSAEVVISQLRSQLRRQSRVILRQRSQINLLQRQGCQVPQTASTIGEHRWEPVLQGHANVSGSLPVASLDETKPYLAQIIARRRKGNTLNLAVSGDQLGGKRKKLPLRKQGGYSLDRDGWNEDKVNMTDDFVREYTRLRSYLDPGYVERNWPDPGTTICRVAGFVCHKSDAGFTSVRGISLWGAVKEPTRDMFKHEAWHRVRLLKVRDCTLKAMHFLEGAFPELSILHVIRSKVVSIADIRTSAMELRIQLMDNAHLTNVPAIHPGKRKRPDVQPKVSLQMENLPRVRALPQSYATNGFTYSSLFVNNVGLRGDWLPALKVNLLVLRRLHEMTHLPDSLCSVSAKVLDIAELPLLESLPDCLDRMSGLEGIVLSHLKITMIPNSLANIRTLTMLNVLQVPLERLPDGLGQLPRFAKLIVTMGKLTHLPDDIVNAPLASLILKDNRLVALPSGIGNLTRCSEMHFSNNFIEALPPSIGRCERLYELNLLSNRLRTLPEEIGALKRLFHLDVSANRLESVPGTIGNLRELGFLNLSGNRLRRLDPAMFSRNLAGLRSVSFGANQLSEIPASISNCESLGQLYLQDNLLEFLPDSIGMLSRLTDLTLNNNKLKSLPPSLEKLKYMKELLVRNNHLESLPDVVARMALTSIDASYNKLRWLPSGIDGGHDGAAQSLHFHHNLLEHLPALGNKYCIKIDLSHNHIASMDAFPICNTVNLSHNRLRTLADDLFLDSFTSTVDLSFNDLQSLPDRFLAFVPKIQRSVIIRGNSFVEIPRTLLSPAIRTLDMRENSISESPPEFWEWLGKVPQSVLLDRNSNEWRPFRSASDYPRIARGGTLSLDFVLLEAEGGPDMAASMLLSGAPSADIVWHDPTIITTTATGMECSELSALRREDGTSLIVRKCVCSQGYYVPMFLQYRKCLVCPRFATCTGNRVHCLEGHYGVWDRSGEMECRPCVTHASCRDNVMTPDRGAWWDTAYSLEAIALNGNATSSDVELPAYKYSESRVYRSSDKQMVFTCMNDEACEGGSNSTCAKGYEGHLCAICERGYYSSGHGSCDRCPSPALGMLMFMAGVVTMLLVGLGTFAASIKAARPGSQAWGRQDWGRGDADALLGDSVQVAVQGDSLTFIKVLVAFLQILTVLDVTFDVEWPNIIHVFDGLFGWVNLDWLRSSSLECTWEYFAPESHEAASTTFNYYTSLLITSFLPVLASLGFIIAHGAIGMVASCAQRRSNHMTAHLYQIARLRCIQAHLLLWTFVYLPVSSKALGFFLCDSFNGGSSYWLHGDLSVECYTSTYYSYMPVAIFSIAVFTIGFPTSVVAVFCGYRLMAKDIAKEGAKGKSRHLEKSFSVLSRPYKARYGYWEAVEMVRKVLVGATAMHFGSTPTFKLSVALAISFGATVLHFYCSPYRTPVVNGLAGLNHVLIYATMSVGLLTRLDVSRSNQYVYAGTVMILDAIFITVMLTLVATDLVARSSRVSRLLRKLM